MLLIFIVSFIVSCGGKSAKVTVESEKTDSLIKASVDSSTTDVAKEVRVTKEQFKATDVQLGTIEKKNLASVLKATGYLNVPPQSKASITSPLGGTVKSISVQEGDNVRKGQTLAIIVNPEFLKMQENYLDAQAQLGLAEATYLRQQELYKENVSAKKLFQEAESNYKSLQAKVASLKGQFNLLGINALKITPGNIVSTISVRSPINGNIAKVNVNLGLTVDPSTVLMQVVDNSHLHLDLFVYEQDLPKVKVGQNVDFSLTNLPGKSFLAKIYSIGSAFENETKTIPIHAEINGYIRELIEGMNVIGLINIGDNLTTAVLSNAVVSFSGSDYIFIQKQDNTVKTTDQNEFTFLRIRVKKGITNGGYTEITPLEPVPEGAKVVTNGSFYLMAILTNAGEED
jgi:RND family efflux transporter MFP subunit